jgi:hypothetical protein
MQNLVHVCGDRKSTNIEIILFCSEIKNMAAMENLNFIATFIATKNKLPITGIERPDWMFK